MAKLTKGLAQKALLENLDRFVDSKKSPQDYNLHVALIQIALQLDTILEEQQATRRLLEHVAGAVIR